MSIDYRTELRKNPLDLTIIDAFVNSCKLEEFGFTKGLKKADSFLIQVYEHFQKVTHGSIIKSYWLFTFFFIQISIISMFLK